MIGIRFRASAVIAVTAVFIAGGCSSSSNSATTTSRSDATVASTARPAVSTVDTGASVTSAVASTAPPGDTATSSTSIAANTTSTSAAATASSVVDNGPAGPANVCDLLMNGEANAFTGVTMAQDAADAASCVYDGTDSSRVYIERTNNQTTADLPRGPAVPGLGDAAVSSDSAIDVLVGHTRFTIGTYPVFPADTLLALATTIIGRVTSASVAVPATTTASGVGSETPAATGAMVLSGSVTDTLSQAPTTTGKCRPTGGSITGAALFGGSTGSYIVQIRMPIGSTTFPTTGQESISLTNGADTTKVWFISNKQTTAQGTASLDGTRATVDVDLVPSGSNTTIGPVHLTGTFDC